MSKSLNRVIVEEYLKDLRGGKFKQCRHALSIDDSYCAIGIFVLTYNRITGDNLDFVVNRFDIYRKFYKTVELGCIGVRNDEGWTFSEIADYIEENSPVMNETLEMKEKEYV